MMTRTIAFGFSAALMLMPALALAAPKHKAGDDALQEPTAISYCAEQGTTVQSAEFTSPSTIRVQCAQRFDRGSTKNRDEVPSGAMVIEQKSTSTTYEYEWTLPVFFIAMTLAILGNGDSANGTTN